MRNRLDSGSNVAMSFSVKGNAGHGSLPSWVHDAETGNRYRVIDGDTHDYRPMDRRPAGAHGVIVGLRNKATTTQQATAAQTTGGFSVHHNPKCQPADKYPPSEDAEKEWWEHPGAMGKTPKVRP